MDILEQINQLITLYEEDYMTPGGGFWDRHKGKILGTAGILGAGMLAHQGVLGPGAQHFINTNLRMAGQGLNTLARGAYGTGSTYRVPGQPQILRGYSV